MKIPVVSVVVPVYKTPESFLRLCIESIQNQTIRDIQIILVDDGSPDNCGKICDEYAAQDSRILVLHQTNSGPSAARNNGIRHALGHCLTFVDADDTLASDAWERALEALEREKADCAVFGWINNESGSPVPFRVTDKYTCMSARNVMTMIAGDNVACGGGYPWNKIWNADSLREANGGDLPLFNESLYAYEDKHWTLQALTDLQNVVLLPGVFYDYRFVETSLTNNNEAWYQRQFNAYAAYDCICDYLERINRDAYRSAISMYFRFCFVDLRNMYSWHKQDIQRWKRTKKCLHKICRRIRPGDLKGIKYNFAWVVCLLTCWI